MSREEEKRIEIVIEFSEKEYEWIIGYLFERAGIDVTRPKLPQAQRFCRRAVLDFMSMKGYYFFDDESDDDEPD